MGDIGDVWNAVKDVATLFGSGQSQAMGARAFACPNGVQPGQLDWSNAQEGSLSYSVNLTNRAREWFGASSGTSLRLGVIWQYGGTSADHPGLYLHDAYLWAVLDYSAGGRVASLHRRSKPHARTRPQPAARHLEPQGGDRIEPGGGFRPRKLKQYRNRSPSRGGRVKNITRSEIEK